MAIRRAFKTAGTWGLPLGLLLLGSLAFVLSAGSSWPPAPRSVGEPAVGLAAAPDAPAAIVAREGMPVVPGLDVASIPPRSSGPEVALVDPPPRDAARRALLIETRVADQYRPFRDSLSLP